MVTGFNGHNNSSLHFGKFNWIIASAVYKGGRQRKIN